MVDCPPEIVRDAVDLHEVPAEMSAPAGQGANPVNLSAPDFSGEKWIKPIPSEPQGLMAHLNAALMQEILDVPLRELAEDTEHRRQANDFKARAHQQHVSSGVWPIPPAKPQGDQWSLTLGANRGEKGLIWWLCQAIVRAEDNPLGKVR